MYLIQYYNPNSHIREEIVSKSEPSSNKLAYAYLLLKNFMLPLRKLTLTATPLKNSKKTYISSTVYNIFLYMVFCFHCADCPTNQHCAVKLHTFSYPLPFFENESDFNFRVSMETKGPITPTSQGSSCLIDVFSQVSFTNPTFHKSNVLQTLLHHWITQVGRPII